MSQHDELKRAAEAVMAMNYPWEHTVRDGRLGKTSTEYARLAHPSNVHALIAENERLERIEHAFSEWIEKTDWVQSTAQAPELGRHRADVLRTRIDQFKVENEALRKAIADVDGALEREYWSEYAGLEETRSILDAAMGKGEQS